ncbi:MAG: LppU family putative lipoprotein [Mycobacterium sp.]
MRALAAAVLTAIAIIGGVTGCSSATNAADLKVGDCLKLGGTADRPEATKVACGSPASNFKVVATVKGQANREQCPRDVDSSYSMRNGFSESSNTACLDIDWVVGGCMSVDPANNSDPVRVDCNDRSAPHRQRATQILKDLRSQGGVDQCASGLGYAYVQRRFAVCVENVA